MNRKSSKIFRLQGHPARLFCYLPDRFVDKLPIISFLNLQSIAYFSVCCNLARFVFDFIFSWIRTVAGITIIVIWFIFKSANFTFPSLITVCVVDIFFLNKIIEYVIVISNQIHKVFRFHNPWNFYISYAT